MVDHARRRPSSKLGRQNIQSRATPQQIRQEVGRSYTMLHDEYRNWELPWQQRKQLRKYLDGSKRADQTTQLKSPETTDDCRVADIQ
jgi:hypothetical protein